MTWEMVCFSFFVSLMQSGHNHQVDYPECCMRSQIYDQLEKNIQIIPIYLFYTNSSNPGLRCNRVVWFIHWLSDLLLDTMVVKLLLKGQLFLTQGTNGKVKLTFSTNLHIITSLLQHLAIYLSLLHCFACLDSELST